MRFTKMHGAGNDYVYVNGFEERVEHPERVARQVSSRHFGIGSDGLILILPSEKADVRMRMWNADGSEAEMCGNGIRCVAKYAYDHGIARRPTITAETGAGILTLQLFTGADGAVERVRVDMGRPRLTRAEIPMLGDPQDGRAIDQPLAVQDETFRITCVSMGNPHCVLFVDDVARTSRWSGTARASRHTASSPAAPTWSSCRSSPRPKCASAPGSGAAARPWPAAPGPVPCVSPAC